MTLLGAIEEAELAASNADKKDKITQFTNPVTVALVGEDGNAFAILGRVAKAARRAGNSEAEIDAYQAEAMSGDYNHLLATTMDWVEEEEYDDYEDEDDEY